MLTLRVNGVERTYGGDAAMPLAATGKQIRNLPIGGQLGA